MGEAARTKERSCATVEGRNISLTELVLNDYGSRDGAVVRADGVVQVYQSQTLPSTLIHPGTLASFYVSIIPAGKMIGSKNDIDSHGGQGRVWGRSWKVWLCLIWIHPGVNV